MTRLMPFLGFYGIYGATASGRLEKHSIRYGNGKTPSLAVCGQQGPASYCSWPGNTAAQNVL